MTSSARKPTTLRRKLFLARKAAEAVKKHGDNAGGSYSFARAEDVLEEAAKQLEKRGILIIPSMVEETLHFGKGGTIAKAVIAYEVVDTEGDETLGPLRWAGTGHDAPGDKALFKATTGTAKYFLANLLNIPFGTDPEAEALPASKPDSAPDPSVEADRARAKQDRDAEEPDLSPASRALKPVPTSDLPEADWEGLANANA
jgi:hypothetical protein